MEQNEDANFEWDVDVGLLIKLVQNFPHIYDKQHKYFRNVPLKTKTWAKIASTLKVPVLDCIRIWRNIRDRYTRETRTKLKNGIYSRKWKYFDAMSFLNPYIRRRRSLKRIVSSNADPLPMSFGEDSSNHSDINNYDIELKLSPETLGIVEHSNPIEIETTEDISFDTPMIIKSSNAVPQTPTVVSHVSSDEAFGTYVSAKLMEFPPDIRQKKRIQIFKILEDIIFEDFHCE